MLPGFTKAQATHIVIDVRHVQDGIIFLNKLVGNDVPPSYAGSPMCQMVSGLKMWVVHALSFHKVERLLYRTPQDKYCGVNFCSQDIMNPPVE